MSEERDEVPTPLRSLFVSKRVYRAHVDRLLGAALRELRLFDPDLSELGLDAVEKVSALRQFLGASPTHRLYVALHDPSFLMARCPRLLALLGSFPERMFVRQTDGEALKAQDCFLLVDDTHLVRRPVAVQARGVLIMNQPADCTSVHERFEQIWESSLPNVSAVASGL
jgi:hypothetical protein